MAERPAAQRAVQRAMPVWVGRIPNDSQIRNLLDPVEPTQLYEPFWELVRQLDEEGYLDKYQGVGETQWISLDRSQYFEKLDCEQQASNNGKSAMQSALSRGM